MIRFKNWIFIYVLLSIFTSCEEVIDIDLNEANPTLVVEAILYKDSLSLVHLTQTTSYFSMDGPITVNDAIVSISDGNVSEELINMGDGYYRGSTIIGSEGITYNIEIEHNGETYAGSSYMPEKSDIISISYSKSSSQSAVNPFGDTVFTIKSQFRDNPDMDNFYLIRYITAEEELLERFYLLTENTSNSGSQDIFNDTISFSESIFFDGGEVEMQLLCVDKYVYNYFLELGDILFWKRRVNPPTPYNPESNISNGALGYFAAWSYDSQTVILE